MCLLFDICRLERWIFVEILYDLFFDVRYAVRRFCTELQSKTVMHTDMHRVIPGTLIVEIHFVGNAIVQIVNHIICFESAQSSAFFIAQRKNCLQFLLCNPVVQTRFTQRFVAFLYILQSRTIDGGDSVHFVNAVVGTCIIK